MAIGKQWMTKLQGRDYVTFPGLLDLAHQTGCIGIVPDLIQIPSSENGNVAITRATVTFYRETGVAEGEWREQTWVAYGDASPANVNKMIASALIRMSETRAIGRALRMACNVGQTMAEELAEGTVEPEGRPGAEPKGENGHTTQTASHQSARAPANLSVEKKKDPEPIEPLVCHQCQAPVAERVAAIAKQRWGAILCVDHGKEMAAIEKARLPAEAKAA